MIEGILNVDKSNLDYQEEEGIQTKEIVYLRSEMYPYIVRFVQNLGRFLMEIEHVRKCQIRQDTSDTI